MAAAKRRSDSNSHQTPHTSPSRTSYGMSIVKIWDKSDWVMTAQHCASVICCKSVLIGCKHIQVYKLKLYDRNYKNVSLHLDDKTTVTIHNTTYVALLYEFTIMRTTKTTDIIWLHKISISTSRRPSY